MSGFMIFLHFAGCCSVFVCNFLQFPLYFFHMSIIYILFFVIFYNGEIAEKCIYRLDQDKIDNESRYDVFYAVITNLDCNVKEIIRMNQQRWEIEENFRIMKTEFEARSVYVQRDDRIKAHFLTCYLSLLLYRLVREETRRGIYM